MPTITFDNFRGGLDARPIPSVSDSNRLTVLRNAYVTHGYTIKKRPGRRLVHMLAPGTSGLVSAGGKLHTFSAGAVSHGTTAIVNHRAPHQAGVPLLETTALGEMFNGFLYAVIAYQDGSMQHFYFDDPGARLASTAYTVGTFRRPATANGLRYEVTAITTGTTGATEPAWPVTLGATVIDGGVTWTCRSFRIVDANCPHSLQVVKKGAKIFAVGNETVRFCATNNARDWTLANDAGFLPVGTHAGGDTAPTALGHFETFLAVFFGDAVQTWAIGPNPATHALHKTAYLGTRYPLAVGNIGSDIFFLSQSGIRSMSVANQAGAMQDMDVGSPIDALLREEMRGQVNPKTIYWRGGSMLLTAFNNRVYVYSISRLAKVSAWALWDVGVPVDAATEMDGMIYLRAGDQVFVLDEFAYTDDGNPFEVHIELPYMDCKTPGVAKQFVGIDLAMKGTARVAHRFDPKDPAQITGYVEAEGDTRPGGMIPVELVTTSIAPVIKNLTGKEFELGAISYHYNDLGIW